MSNITNGVEPQQGLILFNDIWYRIFLYCLGTNLLIHGISALVAVHSLRKHKIVRYVPVILILAGFLYPLTGGVVTSCCIAWIYTSAGYIMLNYLAFIFGAGQAAILLLISLLGIYGTL